MTTPFPILIIVSPLLFSFYSFFFFLAFPPPSYGLPLGIWELHFTNRTVSTPSMINTSSIRPSIERSATVVRLWPPGHNQRLVATPSRTSIHNPNERMRDLRQYSLPGNTTNATAAAERYTQPWVQSPQDLIEILSALDRWRRLSIKWSPFCTKSFRICQFCFLIDHQDESRVTDITHVFHDSVCGINIALIHFFAERVWIHIRKTQSRSLPTCTSVSTSNQVLICYFSFYFSIYFYKSLPLI